MEWSKLDHVAREALLLFSARQKQIGTISSISMPILSAKGSFSAQKMASASTEIIELLHGAWLFSSSSFTYDTFSILSTPTDTWTFHLGLIDMGLLLHVYIVGTMGARRCCSSISAKSLIAHCSLRISKGKKKKIPGTNAASGDRLVFPPPSPHSASPNERVWAKSPHCEWGVQHWRGGTFQCVLAANDPSF